MDMKNQKNESVAEFLARGGKIVMAKPMKAKGAQKPQMIKRAYR